eukprot:scaffold57782_cov18-Tisochrysis_lutea.AAC.2
MRPCCVIVASDHFLDTRTYAGPATPIVASLSSGGDREETIGQMYGGKAGEPGVVDKVYLSLGKVGGIMPAPRRFTTLALPDQPRLANCQPDL